METQIRRSTLDLGGREVRHSVALRLDSLAANRSLSGRIANEPRYCAQLTKLPGSRIAGRKSNCSTAPSASAFHIIESSELQVEGETVGPVDRRYAR